ncbi:hypothetical protein BJV78DRAFT_1157210 [Lactifluus subvellereus]|nr:hypothetical protein BJV78DRAFT_1157210 [Lactifluus subvellereus]
MTGPGAGGRGGRLVGTQRLASCFARALTTSALAQFPPGFYEITSQLPVDVFQKEKNKQTKSQKRKQLPAVSGGRACQRRLFSGGCNFSSSPPAASPDSIIFEASSRSCSSHSQVCSLRPPAYHPQPLLLEEADDDTFSAQLGCRKVRDERPGRRGRGGGVRDTGDHSWLTLASGVNCRNKAALSERSTGLSPETISQPKRLRPVHRQRCPNGHESLLLQIEARNDEKNHVDYKSSGLNSRLGRGWCLRRPWIAGRGTRDFDDRSVMPVQPMHSYTSGDKGKCKGVALGPQIASSTTTLRKKRQKRQAQRALSGMRKGAYAPLKRWGAFVSTATPVGGRAARAIHTGLIKNAKTWTLGAVGMGATPAVAGGLTSLLDVARGTAVFDKRTRPIAGGTDTDYWTGTWVHPNLQKSYTPLLCRAHILDEPDTERPPGPVALRRECQTVTGTRRGVRVGVWAAFAFFRVTMEVVDGYYDGPDAASSFSRFSRCLRYEVSILGGDVKRADAGRMIGMNRDEKTKMLEPAARGFRMWVEGSMRLSGNQLVATLFATRELAADP